MISTKANLPVLWWRSAVLTAASVFVLLAAQNINLPGIYYDEVIQVSPALRFIKPAMRSEGFGLSSPAIVLRGHRLPLMTMGYLGGLKTLVFVPIAATVKLSPASIRYTTILLGALALLAMAAFARRFLGPAAAALAAVLLATDPSYLIFCHADYGPTVLMMLLKAVAMWQLMIWWQSGRAWPLYRGALAMGLGVYDKTNFLWILIALAGSVLLIAPGSLVRLKRKEIAIAACYFIIGCLPLIYYNRHWPPPTLAALRSQNLVAGTDEVGMPHSFPQFESRLQQRVHVLAGVLESRNVPWVSGVPSPRIPWTSMVIIVASIVVLVGYCLPSKRRRWRREMILLLAVILIVLLATMTPGANKTHHLILTYPFPHLLIAAVVIRVTQWCYQMRTPLLRIAAVAVFLVGAAGPVMAGVLRYHQVTVRLQETGGTGTWSDGIYALDAWLESHDPSQPVVILDWGIQQNLAVLSQGRLPCVDRWYAADAAAYQEFFDVPGSRYVFHAPSVTQFPQGRAVFLEAVRFHGLQLRQVASIADRTGSPVFEIHTLSRATSTPSPPQ